MPADADVNPPVGPAPDVAPVGPAMPVPEPLPVASDEHQAVEPVTTPTADGQNQTIEPTPTAPDGQDKTSEPVTTPAPDDQVPTFEPVSTPSATDGQHQAVEPVTTPAPNGGGQAQAPPVQPVSTPSEDGGDAGGDAGDDLDGDLEAEEHGGRPNRKKVEIDLRFLLAILVVVALAAGAYALGQRQGNKLDQAVDGSTGTTVFKAPKEFVPLADPATGVKLSVPRDWVQYSTKDLPDKALRLSVGIPNTGDTVVVRVSSYSTEITEANLGDQKNVFDQLLGAENIQVFVNQPTKLGGLPALFYVYRFTDQATGKAGIHAHYFVFQGRKMVSLIFQALPETRYETLAPTFDTVANSLEVAPGPPPDFLQPPVPDSTPTTAAPGTPSAPAPAPPTTG